MQIHVAGAQRYGQQSALDDTRHKTMVETINRMLHAASIRAAQTEAQTPSPSSPDVDRNVFSCMVRFLSRVRVALQFDVLKAQARVLKANKFLKLLDYEADRCIVSVSARPCVLDVEIATVIVLLRFQVTTVAGPTLASAIYVIT